MPLRPERFGDVPTGLPPYHTEFLRKIKAALEILMGAMRSQTDTGENPESKAATFADLASGAVNTIGTVTEYANNAAAVAAGLGVGDLYRTGDALKVVH